MTRLTRDEYGLKLAEAAALRADCTRRQVGAVIVAPDGSVVSTGYNGLAAGRPGCASAGACPRGQMAYPSEPPLAVGNRDTLTRPSGKGTCLAKDDDGWVCTRAADEEHDWHVASVGSRVLAVWPAVGTQPVDVAYEETGCRAVHAEVNAIIRAGRDRCIGATIYVTDEPCFHCSVVIEGAGLVRVVTPLRWSQEETESVVHPAPVEVPVVIGDAEPVTGTVTGGVLTIPRAASTSGPLDPEILAALQRQEERVKAIKSAEATRAELAKRHEGWQP